MPKITRWQPDTCGCIIDVEGDWEAPDSVKSIRKCAVHAGLSDGLPHLNEVWKGENQRKNYTWSEIESRITGIKLENFKWSFDAARVLRVEFEGVVVTPVQKTTIQKALDNKFGPGKVQVI